MTVSPEYPIKRRCDVCTDEQFRWSSRDEWLSLDEVGPGNFSEGWVEVRPKQLPNPIWDDVDRIYGPDSGVTTVGEMRDRTDLDQWEYADSVWGAWYSWPAEGFTPETDDFPVIVRRKANR